MDVLVFRGADGLDIEELSEVQCIAVIDVLRGSSTTVAALAAGAPLVIPVAKLEEALELARRLGAILAGERGGRKLPFCDLGNSPAEMLRAKPSRPVVLTTTNFTRYVELAKGGGRTVIAACFLNLSAAAEYLRRFERVALIACDEAGVPSPADRACAERLRAMLLEDAEAPSPEELVRLRKGRDAAELIELGASEDVELCLGRVDMFNLVPVLRPGDLGFRAELTSRQSRVLDRERTEAEGWIRS